MRQLGKNFERYLTLIKWYKPKRDHQERKYTAHMLAVKNPDYLRIGKIAVASFLFHNPGSKVTIHCDKITKNGAENVFKRFIKKGLVNLSEVPSDIDPWQIQKIQLFKQICNLELNFYMDCDVRWNGTLDLPSISTCYVREFKLKDKSPFRELISTLQVFEPEVEMLNSTFVYLFPGHFDGSEFNQMFSIYEDILSKCRSGFIADLDIEQIERLSEQLAFSIFIANTGRDFSALKSKDGHMDGRFLESSYFGATGVEF
jgi:hypothetical protein